MVFAGGVLTGTPFPGAGRHSVGAKSPMTGLFGESEAGGFWGAELRHAGWDGIVFHGRADAPVYLWIKDDVVEIRDASKLWGMETGEVEDALRAEHGERLLRVAQTGIAGEHQVRFALVVNDLNEVAGRGGMGAVMGSKNLKAIAVRGTQKVPVADPKPLQATAMWVKDTMEDVHYNFHHYGTGAGIIGKHLEGHMIVRNFQDGSGIPRRFRQLTPRPSPKPTGTRWMAAMPARCVARNASKMRRWACCHGSAGPNTKRSARSGRTSPSAICRW